MRVIVTGSRNWTDSEKIFDDLSLVFAEAFMRGERLTVVHGDCPYGGADKIAADWAARSEFLGVKVEPHPADWDTHGKAAGPIRNQEMVNLGADLVLAYPDADSKGTKDCMYRAAMAGIPVVNQGQLYYSFDVGLGEALDPR